MVESEQKMEQLLSEIAYFQKEQTAYLRKIKNWVVFFGILTLIGMIFASCSALLAY